MQTTPTRSKRYDIIAQQCADSTPPAIINAICAQMDLEQESTSRIKDEGTVVRDMKGCVVAHPCITVSANAIKLYSDLLGKWKRKNIRKS